MIRLIRTFYRVLLNQEKIMSALEDLTAQVAKIVTSVEAAVAALGSSGDATQLAALTAQLATAQAALDVAVASRSTSAAP